MRNPLSRRPAAPEDQPTEVVEAVVPADADPAAATVVLDGPAVPAGAGPPADRLGFRDRGRLRRRLRYLRRVRELGFRDLGGLTFDLHRFGREADHLVRGKLNALAAVDAELRQLERALGEERDVITLHEAGIAACPRCGALHGSEARFCPSCGISLGGALAVAEVSAGAPPGAVAATPPAGSLFQDAPLPGPPDAVAPEPEPEPEPVAAAEPVAAPDPSPAQEPEEWAPDLTKRAPGAADEAEAGTDEDSKAERRRMRRLARKGKEPAAEATEQEQP